MAITCPYCRHAMSLKDAKPGRYQPKCARCGERFALTISADPAAAPVVESLRPTTPGPPTTPGGGTVAGSMAGSYEQTSDSLPAGPSGANGNANAPGADATGADATNAGEGAKAVVGRGGRSTDFSVDVPPGEMTTDATPSSTRFEATLDQGANGDATRPEPPSGPGGAPSPGAAASPGGALARGVVGSSGSSGASGTIGSANLPSSIGGYRILKELGHGAMGAVYLARQVSLDREVALKTILPERATKESYIARFTREAYAAAQLSHHNMVQIYDLGVDQNVYYFSMEYVRGESLDRVVKREGSLKPEVAVGYVLQAARGLHYAHQHGMVHRDIKPSNLMINEHGIVKVADLGLVKIPGEEDVPETAEGGGRLSSEQRSAMLAAASSRVTLANVAVGTPAYMAPEQSENAAGVDHRADIYSLGCTLYVLLSGRPPFTGGTALEIISKHRTQPIVIPEAVVQRIPKRLAEITLKMVAKRPEERYVDLAACIRDLEDYLGVSSSAEFRPTADDLARIEQAAQRYNSAPKARLRSTVSTGLVGVAALFTLAGLLLSFSMTIATLSTAAVAAALYFVWTGLRDRTFLFGKMRELVFGSSLSDRLTAGAGLLVAVLLLWAITGLTGVIGVGVTAAIVAAGLAVAIDRPLAAQRREPLDVVEQWLKAQRLRGVPENSLRQFVAGAAGEHWEEFFEALFGYQAKLEAREAWGRDAQGRPRRKFRPWREWLVRWCDSRLAAARAASDRRKLQEIEQRALQAQGVKPEEAKAQAAGMAQAMVDEAKVARTAEATVMVQTPIDPKVAAEKKRQKIKTMLDEARGGKVKPARSDASGGASLVGSLFGAKIRFLAGCLLIAVCLIWAKQNGLLRQEVVDDVRQAASQVEAKPSARLLGVLELLFPTESNPLPWPVIGRWFDSINPGVAGLVLVATSLLGRGLRTGLFAFAAAAVLIFGAALGVPGVAALGGAQATCFVIGLALGVAGVILRGR